MSEAPKKIWIDPEYATSGWNSINDYLHPKPYIRADLVDELVAALELLASYGNIFSYKVGQENPYVVAKAALAKIKEEE